MATGIVLSVDDTGNTGKVQVDETNEVLSFRDLGFPNSGLIAGSACTFTIAPDFNNPDTYYATRLAAIAVPVPPPTNITSPFTGDLTANVGDVLTVSGATAIVTGNLIINGGKIIVEQNAQVNGTLHSITDGTLVARKGGQIKGGINVDSGGNLKVVNKGQIKGGINVMSAGRMIVGNENGPGFITGTIDISHIRKLTITADSKINT